MTEVPCNGCTACCHEIVILSAGEDPAQYETDPAPAVAVELIEMADTISLQGGRALKRRPDGACVYLGDAGCTIYDRRPEMCRAFDCRGCIELLGLETAIKMALAGDEVMRAAFRLRAAERQREI